jgi:molybdenum cofactor synthesis domain-containing protein
MTPAPTAAVVLIGNELLSGKIRDENAAWLAGRLRTLGIDLRRISTIPDDPDDIITEVRACAARHTHVFTSGGIGPTHDDITLETLARAWDVPLVLDPTLAEILHAHFGARITDDHLRMARVPEGTRLVAGGPIAWPVMCFGNVYILPGVPEIFRAKFEVIAETFHGTAFYLRNLYLNSDEGQIAPLLRRVEAAFAVQIGSYPRIDRADHRVRITVEARDPAPVDAALDALLAGLTVDEIVRVDPPLKPR